MIGFFVLDSLMLRRLIIHTSITQNEQEIHLQSSTYSNMHISHYRLVIYIYVYLFKKKRSMGFQQSEYELEYEKNSTPLGFPAPYLRALQHSRVASQGMLRYVKVKR